MDRPFWPTESRRRPTYAIVLMMLSRSMLVALIGAIAWAAVLVRPSDPDAGGSRPASTTLARSSTSPSGMSVATMLGDLEARSRRSGASIEELDLTRTSGSDASIRMVVDVAGPGSVGVDRLVASLGEGRLLDVTPRTIEPVPAGARLIIEASFVLEAVPATYRARDGRAVAVVLTELTERSGADLVGLEIPARPEDAIRLAASGSMPELVRLIADIEQDHSAPLRFRSVTIRRATRTQYLATLVFGLREDIPAAAPEVDR